MQAELKVLMDMASTSLTFAKDLLRHNLVIFRGGEGALQVLPQLLGVIPEARLNLAIYHLKQGMGLAVSTQVCTPVYSITLVMCTYPHNLRAMLSLTIMYNALA